MPVARYQLDALPLLNTAASVPNPRVNGSHGAKSSLSAVRKTLPLAVWLALGCLVGASIGYVMGTSRPSPAAPAVVVQQQDLLASCTSLRSSAMLANGNANTSASDDATSSAQVAVPPKKKKPGNWFLGGDDPEVLLTEIPKAKAIDELPRNWDWRNYNNTGISLLTSVMNQMVPRPCGSCWAFATISALSDRIRIAKYLKYGTLETEVILSPQVLLDCGMRSFGSCAGGDPRYAHKWIHEHGIVDVTCNPYIASHPSWFGIGEDCAATQCRKCDLAGVCRPMENPTKYYISEYGTLNATTLPEFELEAMNEIYHRGPIVVSMWSHSKEYIEYTGGYVLRDATKYHGTTHVVSIVGWGVSDEGVKYWVVRNSDGTNWGDKGFLLVERGTNTFNLEGHGAWAVPVV